MWFKLFKWFIWQPAQMLVWFSSWICFISGGFWLFTYTLQGIVLFFVLVFVGIVLRGFSIMMEEKALYF